MAPHTTAEYLNGKQLAARGWTPAMIRDFLGSPDGTEYITRFPNAAPMLQFALSRVRAIESTAKFAERLQQAARRSTASREAAERRRAEMLRLVAEEVPIPRLPPDVLTDRAVRHSEPREAVDAAKADRRTLNRWKVNYLRHELTQFDATIESMFGQVGRVSAEKILRRRALETIAGTYPDLLEECQRQMRISEGRPAVVIYQEVQNPVGRPDYDGRQRSDDVEGVDFIPEGWSAVEVVGAVPRQHDGAESTHSEPPADFTDSGPPPGPADDSEPQAGSADGEPPAESVNHEQQPVRAVSGWWGLKARSSRARRGAGDP